TELSTELRLTAVLSLWGAQGPIVALVHEDTSRSVLVTVRAGTSLDLGAAQSRVFLAHTNDQHALERITDGPTPAEKSDPEAGVNAARRDGYSIVGHSGGVFGAAAPVFDEYGICATIGLIGAGSTTDLTPESPPLSRLLTTAA